MWDSFPSTCSTWYLLSGFFTHMRKSVKSAASVFLHLSPWGESCYFTPIFCAKILPTNYVSPRLPFVMFILQKILTNFAHYYGKIQLLAINHLWKACFMLYAICTSYRVHKFCLLHLFHIFSTTSNSGSIFFLDKLQIWNGLQIVASAKCWSVTTAMILKFSVIAEPLIY